MKQLLQNAFTFNVTFENGTTESVDFAQPSMAIGTRMLYQLRVPESVKWGEFITPPAHHVTPTQVLKKLMQITGDQPRKKCVILCVDSLQKLQHEPGSKTSTFYRALEALCDLVNSSDCWVVAIGSATIYQPVKEFLASSPQWRVLLPTARLSRPKFLTTDVFEAFGNEDLTQLLINDMGGFGRCVEVLYSVMLEAKRNGAFNFLSVLEQVEKAMREAYPAIEEQIKEMREAFLAVLARRVVNTNTTFGGVNLDDVISAGLIRRNGSQLECPYILYLMLDTADFPWDALDSYIPRQKREDAKPWQLWERFNCKFRVLKSIAYAEAPPVKWTDVHHGAYFSSGCDRTVREVPRTYQLCKTHMVTKSQGFSRGRCSYGNDSQNPVFLYQPANGSPSGDSFLCLEDVNNGFFMKFISTSASRVPCPKISSRKSRTKLREATTFSFFIALGMLRSICLSFKIAL